ncbi:hypothetical protein HHX38_28635 [Streptomyces sp. PKU-MA01144]|uniref:hypothetical protein n=1 Tax=Streptomyces sp. PKU-MA01144 TaxID=2729138 RepID=UPI00148176B6|nr:hypothetical protein [Streptomyces sp. PKU-MA01144]NNJ08066.1 hypothetical protein [Streptomyces sp. PKU-MA01144]
MNQPNPYQDGGDYQWGPAYPPDPAEYGHGFAPAPLAPPGGQGAPGLPGAPLLMIGDITVVQDSVVTPNGTLPLKGAVWNVTDLSRTEEKTPTHAIVLAVVFSVFCLLGLLFLLMKERRTTGFVQVGVAGGGRHHTTMIPATGPETLYWVMGQVGHARLLSA